MKSKRQGILLTIFILLVLSVYFYGHKITDFPSEIHAWTESDRLALAIGYYENGHQLFLPQTYEIETKDRVTAVDFPLIEWLVSFIMRLAGSADTIWFRCFHLLISFIGYVFLYKIVFRWTNSIFKSLFSVVFVFITPIITYYQAGFLPSSACFSFLFIGYFFYFKFLEKRESNSDLYLAILFIGTAALMRKSYLVFLVALWGQECLYWLRNKKIVRENFIAFLMMFFLFGGYFVYNQYLTKVYGTRFLNHLCPPKDWSNFVESTSIILSKWSAQAMSMSQYIIYCIVVFLGVWFSYKKINDYDKKIWTQIIISGIGSFLFFVAMIRQFFDHEYYFIDSFYPVVFLVFFWTIFKVEFHINKFNYLFASFGAILLIVGIYQSKLIQKEKDEPIHWKRLTKVLSDFEGSDKVLDSLGISKEATVLVLEAYSTNSPLLLMKRKGHTFRSNKVEKLKKVIEIETDYVAMSDTYFVSDLLAPYPELGRRLQRIGGNGRFSIYKKMDEDTNLDLEKLLGINSNNFLQKDSVLFNLEINDTIWRNVQIDSTFGLSTIVRENQDYGLTYSNVFQAEELDRMLIEGKFKATNNRIGILSFFVKQNGETLHYWEFPVTNYGVSFQEWTELRFLFDIPKRIKGEIKIESFIWNKNRAEIYSKEVVFTGIKTINP